MKGRAEKCDPPAKAFRVWGWLHRDVPPQLYQPEKSPK